MRLLPGRIRLVREDDPPRKAICIEQGCSFPATHLRPATREWSAEGRELSSPDGVEEWVCSTHAPG